VLDDTEAQAFVAQGADEVAQFPHKDGINARSGLVQQHDARFEHERTAEFEELFLPAGKRVRLCVREAPKIDAPEQRTGAGECLVLGPFHAGPTPQRRQHAFARLARKGEQQVLQNREGPEFPRRSETCA